MDTLNILRFGESFESSRKRLIRDCNDRPISEISMAIPLMFRLDIKKKGKKAADKLRNTDIKTILGWIKKAADIFAYGTLKIDGMIQSPQDYCSHVMRVTGIPLHMCNEILMEMKGYLEQMEEIIMNQFRLSDLTALDNYHTSFQHMQYGLAPKSDVLGAVTPGNHPVVNIMWVMAFAMKYPIVIKPSFDEPYTPLRLIYSLIEAGADREYFSYYPINHIEVVELLNAAETGIIFGGNDIKVMYGQRASIRVYGPGNSKIVVSKEYMDDVQHIAEHAANSALYHSGRACISTSSVITEAKAEDLANAIGRKFAEIKIKDLTDKTAVLAAVRDREKAQLMADAVKNLLRSPDFVDMTPEIELLQYHDGYTFLMPKVLYCKNVWNENFGTEYSFPFIMVGQAKKTELGGLLGETLCCNVLTDNPKLMRELLLSQNVEKIFHGFKDPCMMDFGMPHNGYLSEFLYKYKAFKG